MIPSPCAETSTPVYMFPVTITPLQGTLPFSLPLATPRVHGPCSVTCSARPCAARGHRLWCDRSPDAMALNISTDANYAGQLIPPSTPNIHLMGMTLVCGRLLNDFDTENTPVAAVIIFPFVHDPEVSRRASHSWFLFLPEVLSLHSAPQLYAGGATPRRTKTLAASTR
jgi:hypothetical protein